MVDITLDARYAFPVPGTCFLFRGNVVDLKRINAELAERLANDPACQFIQLAATSATIPANGTDENGAEWRKGRVKRGT